MNLTPPSSGGGECGNCGGRDKRIPLHNVRLRGIYRRLCTSCLLKLHPSSFCPSCFSLHEPNPPPPSKRFCCSKCSSFTHSHCATSPSSPFLCPPCSDPSFSFFRVPDNGAIDKKLASVLLCAAKIASSSMAKAVVVARAEAERRVREAALYRKRAREALENVAVLVAKDSNTNTNNGLKVNPVKGRKEVESSVEVSASANSRGGLGGVNGNGINHSLQHNGNSNDNSAQVSHKDGVFQDKS